ncbi:MAG: chitobiase/beta-hexosaminidase C-terminal domain-containing protein [Terracidiphilus sp.]|jgi:parallel beta-helix repeat protein
MTLRAVFRSEQGKESYSNSDECGLGDEVAPQHRAQAEMRGVVALAWTIAVGALICPFVSGCSYFSGIMLPTPSFNPPAGAYSGSQSVTISDASLGTTIYYTTDGSTPTTASTVYGGSVTVSTSETLEAIATRAGSTNSAVAIAAYTITPAQQTLPAPTFTPPTGSYNSSQSVTISDTTAGTTIYYTTDGSTPSAASTVYTGPITVSTTETLQAIAAEAGFTNSPVAIAAYTITPVQQTLPAPTFTPPAGPYSSSQSVTISDTTAGTTIYYTTDGSTPSTASTVYSGPITVNTTETLEAIATKAGFTNSPVAIAAYTITPVEQTLPAPTFAPPAGSYSSSQSVTISDATTGTTIYYTTDGSTPSTASTVYSGPITVSTTETLEAIATETNYANSPVAIASYSIGSGPASLAVCGVSSILAGPSSPPSGAVVVPAGDNSALTPNYANPGFSVPNTTFWFEPGIHTLGTGIYSQIQPGQGDVYIGAPGAIISGQNINQSAFDGTAANVTIEYLTVQDFTSAEGEMVVNHDGGSNWTIAYNTIQNNTGGAGVGLGPNTAVTSNCLTNNGEYGFSSLCSGSGCDALTGGPANVTLANNEISLNDSAGAYDQPGGISCGCSGGGKLWHVNGANITGNYVHDNGNVGIWADTDNTGVNISGNTISNNYAEGIIIEISYNFSITNNTLTNNDLSSGYVQAGQNIFPAIYISESGGDSRVPGNLSGEGNVQGNTFTDNWSGITLWENSNRFCSDSSDDACTLVDPSVFTQTSCAANLPTAVAGTNTGSPAADYYDGCRWKTQNVHVGGNVFNFTPANIPNCTIGNLCGFNGLFSNYGSTVPYTSASVPTAIAFHQGNLFQNNTYYGPWNYWAWNFGNQVTWAEWMAPVTDSCGTSGEIQSGECTSGFGQDSGSTTQPSATTRLPSGH